MFMLLTPWLRPCDRCPQTLHTPDTLSPDTRLKLKAQGEISKAFLCLFVWSSEEWCRGNITSLIHKQSKINPNSLNVAFVNTSVYLSFSIGCKMVVGGCLDPVCFTSTTHVDYIRCECSSNLCNGNITWSAEEKQPQLKHSSYSAGMDTVCFLVIL